MRCKTSLAAIARGHLASRIPFARGAARSFIRLERRFKWCEEFLILNLLSRGARSALSLALLHLSRSHAEGGAESQEKQTGAIIEKGLAIYLCFPRRGINFVVYLNQSAARRHVVCAHIKHFVT
jgi:hypothetical protein